MLSHRVDGLSYCSSISRAQHETIGFAKDQARVIPNAVDTATFRPDSTAHGRISRLLGIPTGRKIVGNVARSHPMKDHVSMVRVIARLLSDGRDVHGVLLGPGQTSGPGRKEADVLGIANRVSFFESRPDVAELVPGFDVFLLSSAWGEAFPVAVAEAMAAGVPCVVTDVGDCAELVGSTGIVVPPRDVDSMARAVQHFLDLQPADRSSAGLAARARVSEHFSFKHYVEAHKVLYAEALRKRRGYPQTSPAQRTVRHE
jgi:glycosyltransferase involved in cell wall biosynthesis